MRGASFSPPEAGVTSMTSELGTGRAQAWGGIAQRVKEAWRDPQPGLCVQGTAHVFQGLPVTGWARARVNSTQGRMCPTGTQTAASS